MFAHTLLALGLSTGLVGLFWGRQSARSWVLGYLGHLLGDSAGFVPWLYPWVGYNFPQHSPGLVEIILQALSDPAEVALELALAVWVFVTLGKPQLKAERS
jgi:hypothetical protein